MVGWGVSQTQLFKFVDNSKLSVNQNKVEEYNMTWDTRYELEEAEFIAKVLLLSSSAMVNCSCVSEDP